MFKPGIYFNDYVSLAVMLLMAFALVAGQTDASADHAEISRDTASIVRMDDATRIDLKGYISEKAIQVSVDVITDLSQFRGEDE